MDGIKKAALFLSGLDYTEMDQLLSRLDGESAKLIRREISSLRTHRISVEETQRLDQEFLHTAGWTPAAPVREHQFATPTPITYTLPKRAAVRYTAEAFVPPALPFDFMRNWSINDVVSAIIDEHPQTIVVVLAHLSQSKMKSVVSVLPLGLQKEIKFRLDEFEMPNEEVIHEVELALKTRYRRQRCQTPRRSATLESFDDIEMLSDSDLSTLFRSVDLTTAMLALIGMDAVLIARIIKHFSPTEEREMRKRSGQLQSVDEEDIEQARHDILTQYNETL